VKAFFDAIRHQFGGKMTQAQVEGCETLIRATDGLPLAWRAYLLATGFHETARTMQPITEMAGSISTSMTRGSLAKALGNTWRLTRWVQVSRARLCPDHRAGELRQGRAHSRHSVYG
jgi:hypothetical protein